MNEVNKVLKRISNISRFPNKVLSMFLSELEKYLAGRTIDYDRTCETWRIVLDNGGDTVLATPFAYAPTARMIYRRPNIPRVDVVRLDTDTSAVEIIAVDEVLSKVYKADIFPAMVASAFKVARGTNYRSLVGGITRLYNPFGLVLAVNKGLARTSRRIFNKYKFEREKHDWEPAEKEDEIIVYAGDREFKGFADDALLVVEHDRGNEVLYTLESAVLYYFIDDETNTIVIVDSDNYNYKLSILAPTE